MPKSSKGQPRALAEAWTAPAMSPAGEIGRPLICLATTYTFHAEYLEGELLPRFLGLKFDETEGMRPFIVEREQALGTVRASILVDADHLDPAQTTLRWDQLPVRVPSGAQHAKIVLLLWENYARLIVSSANLTRSGYRRNREIAGVIDFFDHQASAPRRLFLDALDFLSEVSPLVKASEPARARWNNSLTASRARLRAWRNISADFAPRERPRVMFVGGLPRRTGAALRSPLRQAIDHWGTRRAEEITVITPFVGDIAGANDPVIDTLMTFPRTRDARGFLVVPGRPKTDDPARMIVALPARFRDAWAAAWRTRPDDVETFVVPPSRTGDKVSRDLHAKGILVSGDGTTMLLCGSSNFSPHGMGLRVANVEANLCYIDDQNARRDGSRLEDRLPVDWSADRCETAFWPPDAEPLEDDAPSKDPPLPAAFLWGIYNQRTNSIVVTLDLTAPLPPDWSLHLPGERTDTSTLLFDGQHKPWPPHDEKLVATLPDALKGVNIPGLRLNWRDEAGGSHSGILPVHVESMDDLLPPEEIRSLKAQDILDCLISGKELAEWVDGIEKRREIYDPDNRAEPEYDPLRSIDTSGYLLYRTRRLGAALTALGDRLDRTVRTPDALSYKLRQDPLGPRALAESLVQEWRGDGDGVARGDATHVIFSLIELNLTLAHIAQRVVELPLRKLFGATIEEIEGMQREIVAAQAPPENLQLYMREVARRQVELLA